MKNDMQQRVEQLLSVMIARQRAKVAALADRIAPEASRDDRLNPQDVAALNADPQFNYEDGVLAGLLSAQIALRAEWRMSQPAQTETTCC